MTWEWRLSIYESWFATRTKDSNFADLTRLGGLKSNREHT